MSTNALKTLQAGQLQALGDPRRLWILRALMTAPATISQIGAQLGKHPAWVRHHMQVLVASGLVELAEERKVKNYTEKYYKAVSSAFEAHMLIAPLSEEQRVLLALGSDDPGLELVAADIRRAHIALLNVPVGSLDGLIALRQGLCDVAGCHLLDEHNNEYNIPYLRHLFPDMPVVAVTLASREQGLLAAPGNPLAIHDVADLARGHVRLANRNMGSGTRVWLDTRLNRSGIDPSSILGYDVALPTHTAVASAIANGQADAGIGLRVSAERFGLSFTPLFVERYDLVVRKDQMDDTRVTALLDFLSSRHVRRAFSSLPGYDATHTGEEAGSSQY